MTDASSKIDHLIETCFRIEETLASLYSYFEQIFGTVPELAAVWRKTAMEEENHAQQFRLATKLPKLIAEAKVDVLTADQLLLQLQDLSARMRKLAPPPGEALQAAIEAERSLARYHMHTIGVFNDPNAQQMFGAMMAADRQHVETLTEAFNRFAQPPANA